jgi:siroheme synthase
VNGFDAETWRALARSGATLAVYMGTRTWPLVRRALLEAGMAPNTPVHLCRSATRPESRIIQQRLRDSIPHTGPLPTPTLIVVGSDRITGDADTFGSILEEAVLGLRGRSRSTQCGDRAAHHWSPHV